MRVFPLVGENGKDIRLSFQTSSHRWFRSWENMSTLQVFGRCFQLNVHIYHRWVLIPGERRSWIVVQADSTSCLSGRSSLLPNWYFRQADWESANSPVSLSVRLARQSIAFDFVKRCCFEKTALTVCVTYSLGRLTVGFGRLCMLRVRNDNFPLLFLCTGHFW